MKKKGFTLIELLAVIIILAVIALIATPVVLNVVENARREANKNSVYGLLDAAKLYYAESLLDESKKQNVNGTTNLIEVMTVSGDKPDSGAIYINNKGETALSVVYDKVCYVKKFESNNLIESEDIENCSLDIEETPIVPSEPITPEVSYKCIRATQLHTEECVANTNSCSNVGYTEGGSKGTTTITYGNKEVTEGVLTSGDAFDCVVNIDENGNEQVERFYYVSDLESNSDYAVLIYYVNTTNGVANKGTTNLIAYDSSNENWHGPVTAISNLPTETQWSNIKLSNKTRAILTESTTSPTATTGGTLPTAFSYTKTVDGVTVPLAARLLTYQEILSACGEGNLDSVGRLEECEYLMENTTYSSTTAHGYGFWLESPDSRFPDRVWRIMSRDRGVYSNYVNITGDIGVRPAIEVLKTDIQY